MDYNEFCTVYNIRGLNPQQEEAVKRVEGATLLLAVPGSGKTTVIVARTGYMLNCAGINPQNILTLTFTIAAANEMKERFIKKFNCPKDLAPHFSTIHSFCLKVINTCKHKKGEAIPDLEPNNERIVREICVDMLPEYPSDMMIRSLAQQITNAKNRMLTDTDIKKINVQDIEFPEFYSRYQKRMETDNLMDFDDQLIFAYRFLMQYPDILEMYQKKYCYISVDEAQDTSHIQHSIIRMLAKRHNNIFMVGDDDQSVYGFRGAYPQALLNFDRTYPDAVILSMEINYRSHKKIVSAANGFIKQNKNRHNKEMAASSIENGSVIFTAILDMKEQYKLLVKKVIESQISGQSLAILYRNNESAMPLISLLRKEGISTKYRDDGKLFFTHFVVMDILAFLAFSQNPCDINLYSKLYYKLGLYLNKPSLFHVREALLENPSITALAALKTFPSMDRRIGYIEKKEAVLTGIRYKTPVKAIDAILNGLEYQKHLDRKIGDGYSETSLAMKINTLKAIAQEFNTIPEFLVCIEGLKNEERNHKSNVTLSTIHSSKGLEFDKVIMIDVVGGVLPSDSSQPQEDSEEDVRLFYVGATRAKHEMEFIIAKNAFGVPLNMSPFIRSLQPKTQVTARPKVDIDYTLSSKKINSYSDSSKPVDISGYGPHKEIRHRAFGTGTIVSVQESGIAEISFKAVGTKKLDINVCVRNNIISPA